MVEGGFEGPDRPGRLLWPWVNVHRLFKESNEPFSLLDCLARASGGFPNNTTSTPSSARAGGTTKIEVGIASCGEVSRVSPSGEDRCRR